jgi:hypothetical protein
MNAIADFARTALSMLNRKLLSSEFNTKKLFENGIKAPKGRNAIAWGNAPGKGFVN